MQEVRRPRFRPFQEDSQRRPIASILCSGNSRDSQHAIAQNALTARNHLRIAPFVLAQNCDCPCLGGMNPTKWHEDLAVLREQMPKKHGNLFHSISREQYELAFDDLERRLPEMTDNQVKLGIMQIVASVNDGHTHVRLDTLGNHMLPIRLHYFADGLFVESTDKAYSNLLGGQGFAFGLHVCRGGIQISSIAGVGGQGQRTQAKVARKRSAYNSRGSKRNRRDQGSQRGRNRCGKEWPANQSRPAVWSVSPLEQSWMAARPSRVGSICVQLLPLRCRSG